MSSLQLTGFEILEKRGEGGMATVWKARQVSLNRIVAIKILNTRLARDEADVQRFQSEAQSAARLKHPGIVQVYDARAEHGLYYFVMEYVEGYTAGEWLRRKGVLSEKDVLLLADCVAEALEYAWKKEQIVHCDIKPDNIMIDADGTVKVADLGLSRSINAMRAVDSAGEVLGTPAYISPEQSRGDKAIDFRADIYSLGATMYHLLTGHMLFEGNSDEQIMDLQLTERVDDPLDANPSLCRGVGWLLEKMLAKDPAMRQQSWGAVRADISRVKKKLMPDVQGLPEGCSTIRRGARRKKDGLRSERRMGVPAASSSQKVLLAAGILIALALALTAFLRLKNHAERGAATAVQTPTQPQSVSRADQSSEPTSGEVADIMAPPAPSTNSVALSDAAEKAAAEFAAVRQWVQEHPDDFDVARGKFLKLADSAAGTAYAALANGEAARLATAKTGAINQVMEELKLRVAPLAGKQEWVKVAEVYETYQGRFKSLTAPMREALARDFRNRHEMRVQWAQTKALNKTLEAVVSEVLAGRFAAAAEVAGRSSAAPDLESRRAALERLKGVLAGAAAIDNRVMDSFRAQLGKEVLVQLNSGTFKVQIAEVSERTVSGMENRIVGAAVSTRRLSFTLDDLRPAERLARMGPDDNPSVALVKGVQAFNAHAWALARKSFELTDPLVAKPLMDRVSEMQNPASGTTTSEAEGGGVNHEATKPGP